MRDEIGTCWPAWSSHSNSCRWCAKPSLPYLLASCQGQQTQQGSRNHFLAHLEANGTDAMTAFNQEFATNQQPPLVITCTQRAAVQMQYTEPNNALLVC